MPIMYRRPGVYLEESLLVNSADTASTFTVGCFIGVAEKGPILNPTRVDSWSDYVTVFGGFSPITPPAANDPNDITTESFGTTNYDDLLTLQGDTLNGNGQFPGDPFTAGQYVKLHDGSKAHYLLPALSTVRTTAAVNQMFAADADITEASVTSAARMGVATNETQTLTPSATLTAGQFKLTVRGVQTADIAYNAAAAAIQTAILAVLPNAGGATTTVTGTGTIASSAQTVTFAGYGVTDPITVQAGTTPLVGGTINVATTLEGTGGEGFVATPATAWTTGQNIWVGDHAFYWNGTSWQPGTAGGGQAKENAGSWVANAYPGTGATVPPITKVLSYLPFAVYTYFQSGGRTCWVVRATSTSEDEQGVSASVTVNGREPATSPLRSFIIRALSAGTWGNKIKYTLGTQSTVGINPNADDVFAIQVLVENAEGYDEVVETFSGLSVKGEIPGSRRADVVINDPASGSQYIRITDINEDQGQPDDTSESVALSGGEDPYIPDSSGLVAATSVTAQIEGPMMVNIVGYHNDVSKINTDQTNVAYVSATVPSSAWPDRQDVFVINDSAPPRIPNQPSAGYKTTIQTTLAVNTGDSYSASYAPWILVPTRNGWVMWSPFRLVVE